MDVEAVVLVDQRVLEEEEDVGDVGDVEGVEARCLAGAQAIIRDGIEKRNDFDDHKHTSPWFREHNYISKASWAVMTENGNQHRLDYTEYELL